MPRLGADAHDPDRFSGDPKQPIRTDAILPMMSDRRRTASAAGNSPTRAGEPGLHRWQRVGRFLARRASRSHPVAARRPAASDSSAVYAGSSGSTTAIECSDDRRPSASAMSSSATASRASRRNHHAPPSHDQRRHHVHQHGQASDRSVPSTHARAPSRPGTRTPTDRTRRASPPRSRALPTHPGPRPSKRRRAQKYPEMPPQIA